MTFTEAAVEVLRLVGKPLHYKKIAEIAIERNLLSHVGKTPEITMSSRLATMVKKDQGDAPILKIKPGVFGLREFSKEVLDAAERETGHEYELPEEPAEKEADAAEADGRNATAEAKEHPGGDVFPEEEGDDQPILANLDDEDEQGKRRRRRRRRRKPSEDEKDSPKPEASERKPRGRGERRGRRQETSAVRGDWSRAPQEGERTGLGLADAIVTVLRKDGRPQPYRKVADLLVRDGVLEGDPAVLAPTIAAAVRGDQARHLAIHARPRFRVSEGVLALTDFDFSEATLRAERELNVLAETQRDAVRATLRKHMRDLPPTGFLELVASWLNAEGVVGLHGVRRPAPMASTVHLAGTRKRHMEESRLAIMVLIDGGDIGREHVVDVRGALHHYDNAESAWILTTGKTLRGATEEASSGNGSVALMDGAAVVRALEKVGIGVQCYSMPLLAVDLPLFRELGLGADRGAPKRERGTQEEGSEENKATSEGAAADAENGQSSRRRRRRRGRSSDERKAEDDTVAAAEAEGGTDAEPSSEETSSSEASAEGSRGQLDAEADSPASQEAAAEVETAVVDVLAAQTVEESEAPPPELAEDERTPEPESERL